MLVVLEHDFIHFICTIEHKEHNPGRNYIIDQLLSIRPTLAANLEVLRYNDRGTLFKPPRWTRVRMGLLHGARQYTTIGGHNNSDTRGD